MKVIINKCFGGFSLSPKAVKLLADYLGKKCYFFKTDFKNGRSTYKALTLKEAEKDFGWTAFSAPNPNELFNHKKWRDMSDKEKKENNELYDSLQIANREWERNDPLLIKVVEELGEKANGSCAKLEIVEIPDGIEYQISEYDGMERIEEKHRSWG